MLEYTERYYFVRNKVEQVQANLNAASGGNRDSEYLGVRLSHLETPQISTWSSSSNLHIVYSKLVFHLRSTYRKLVCMMS